MIGTAARAGVAAGVAGRVHRRQQQRWAQEEQQAYAQQPPPQPATPPAAPDYTAELQQLAQLRDNGVISPEDFEAKKKQLLGI